MDGSPAAFAERMDAAAQSPGAAHTHFANPNGLQDPTHLSTARDLAVIARQAMQNPEFAAAVRTKTMVIRHADGHPQILRNTNELLEKFPGADGIKTGWTPQAGHCFVGSVSRNGRRLISVVLNSPDWQADTIALWKYGLDKRGSGVPGSGVGKTMDTEAEAVQNPKSTSRNAAPTDSVPDRISDTHHPNPDILKRIAGSGIPLLLWLLYRKRAAMSRLRMLLAKRKTKNEGENVSGTLVPAPKISLAPSFVFNPSPFPRRSAPEWLNHTLETPTRLLEPAIRHHARAVLDAQPQVDASALLALLDAPQAKLRLAAAELLAKRHPTRAAETLRDLVDNPQNPADVRAESARILSDLNGDRDEPFWRQMLLREGVSFAAHALIAQPEMGNETADALQKALRSPALTASQDDLRGISQRAAIACALAEHGRIAPEEAAEHLERLPQPQKEALITECLRDSRSEWGIHQLVENALHSKGTAALHSLLDTDPLRVRTALDACPPEPNSKNAARHETLRWLLFGEGDKARVQKMAELGDAFAGHALQSSAAHHENLTAMPQDVLFAAAQIVSLRLGYARHTQEDIGKMLRAASSEEANTDILTQNPELAPTVRAYADAQVHSAVQNALHSPHGPENLARELTRGKDDPAYQAEMAFWSDKTVRGTRLYLAHALQTGESEAAQNALAARTADACPQVRELALRSVRARALANRSARVPQSETPSVPVDAAA